MKAELLREFAHLSSSVRPDLAYGTPAEFWIPKNANFSFAKIEWALEIW